MEGRVVYWELGDLRADFEQVREVISRVYGIFPVAAGEFISINCHQGDYRFYRDTAIQEQYNLVCDYLSSLDTRPWWAGDNEPWFQND